MILNKIKLSFIPDDNEKQLMNKRLGKYIADKYLIVLSAKSGIISIDLFATIIGASVWIASVRFCFAFLITSGIVKKLLKTVRNKKKHNKIFTLAWAKYLKG